MSPSATRLSSHTMPPQPESGRPRIVSFLLHAHLPYGFPSGRQNSMEQAWLYEAVTHCYLPLLSILERLAPQDGTWLTVSLSPTLLELWSHPEFAGRYLAHLENGLRVIRSESTNPAHPAERRELALQVQADWKEARRHFREIAGRLPAAFSRLAEAGKIELITTAATHPFLPAFQNDPAFRNFQIENGIETFKRHTGLSPKGFWLPECAYFPGLEEDLAPFGIEYFGLEEQGLSRAEPTASIRAPLACPNGLRAIGRDNALSQKVWNARIGYPGHADYREFHHDGIHQVDTDTCGEFALPDGNRLPFGLKYWRVTGKADKAWYAPARAKQQATRDAADFTKSIGTADEGLVFLPFDAELFGHWWYEGPVWLENVLKLASKSPGVAVQGNREAVNAFVEPPYGRPAGSSWGRKSDYSFWVNRDTDWIYELLLPCSQALRDLVRQYGLPEGHSQRSRAIRQSGRELLLASASDWPFMLRAGTTGDYAMQRLHQHIKRSRFLIRSIQEENLDPEDLRRLEALNPAFETISLAAFSTAS